jgi:hypothetical protein
MSEPGKQYEYAFLYNKTGASQIARSSHKFAVSRRITLDCKKCGPESPVTLLFEVWDPLLKCWKSVYVCARHFMISLVDKDDVDACINLYALTGRQ